MHIPRATRSRNWSAGPSASKGQAGMTKIIFAPPTCPAAAQNLGWAKAVVTNVFEFIRLVHPEAFQPK
jgi:hypothetical protein